MARQDRPTDKLPEDRSFPDPASHNRALEDGAFGNRAFEGRAFEGRAVDTAQETVVVRSEEQLRIETVTRPSGTARLRTYEVVEDVQVTVPVRRRFARLEWEPAEGSTQPPPPGTGEDILVAEEEVYVETRMVPRERVRLVVDRVTEDVVVTDTLRRERVDVEVDDLQERG